jgi:hypothetical protein
MKAQLKVGEGSGDLDSILGLTAPLTPDYYPIHNDRFTWAALAFSIILGALSIRWLNNILARKMKKTSKPT